MQAYAIRVPNPPRLAAFLNKLEGLGFSPNKIVTISGQVLVVVLSSFPLPKESFLQLENGNYILLEDGSKIII